MKRKRKAAAVCMALIVAGWALLYAGNNWLQVSQYEIVLEGLPEKLAEVQIVHISDLQARSSAGTICAWPGDCRTGSGSDSCFPEI